MEAQLPEYHAKPLISIWPVKGSDNVGIFSLEQTGYKGHNPIWEKWKLFSILSQKKKITELKALSDAWTQIWLFWSGSTGLSVISTITFLFSSFCTKYHMMEHIMKLSIIWVHTTRTTWDFSNRTYGHWKMPIYQKWNTENTTISMKFCFGKKIEWSATIKSILHLNIAPSKGFLFRWNCTIDIKNKSRSQNKCSKFLMDYQLIFWSKTRGTYARKGKNHTHTPHTPQPSHRILQLSENLKTNSLCSHLVLRTS